MSYFDDLMSKLRIQVNNPNALYDPAFNPTGVGKNVPGVDAKAGSENPVVEGVPPMLARDAALPVVETPLRPTRTLEIPPDEDTLDALPSLAAPPAQAAPQQQFTPAEMPPPQSSRQKTMATGGVERGVAGKSPMDALAEMLSGREKAATGERNAARAKADQEKDLTDGEKVAMALLAALPALVGAIGGGAIAGGAGAAAGAAGGFQGGAQGVGMINEAKQGRRKEALSAAEKAQERIDRAKEQEFGLTAHREDQKFQSGERAKDRAAQRGDIMLQGKMAYDRALLDAALSQQKAGAAAGGKVTEQDASFFGNVGSGMRSAADIEHLVKKGGANIGAWLSDAENRASLQSAVNDLGFSLTKVQDPGSAVLLGELKNTIETMLANPDTTRTNIFLKKVKEAENKLAARAVDYSNIRPHVPLHPAVQQFMQGGGSTAPQKQSDPFAGMKRVQ